MSFHSFLFSFLFLFSSVFLLTSPNVIVFFCVCDSQERVMGQWFSFWLNPFCLQPLPLACLCSLHASCVCFHSCPPKTHAFLLAISCALNDAWFWVVRCCNSTCTHTHCAFISVLLMCPLSMSKHHQSLLIHCFAHI